MQLLKMRLQFQPDRFPVLRCRFHYNFGDLMPLQPTDQVLAFLRTRSELPADKLQRFPGRIRHLGGGCGHYHHQHVFVYIDRCYSIGHLCLLSSGKGRTRDELNTLRSGLWSFLAKGTFPFIGSNKRVPDQTPSRFQYLQSRYDLGHFPDLPRIALLPDFHHLWWASRPMETPSRSRLDKVSGCRLPWPSLRLFQTVVW